MFLDRKLNFVEHIEVLKKTKSFLKKFLLIKENPNLKQLVRAYKNQFHNFGLNQNYLT